MAARRSPLRRCMPSSPLKPAEVNKLLWPLSSPSSRTMSPFRCFSARLRLYMRLTKGWISPRMRRLSNWPSAALVMGIGRAGVPCLIRNKYRSRRNSIDPALLRGKTKATTVVCN